MEKKIEEMCELVRNHCGNCPYEDVDVSNTFCGTECRMTYLYEQGYRKQSEVAQEIIDLANETIKNISEIVGTDVEVFAKAGIRLIQTKIMERYGV